MELNMISSGIVLIGTTIKRLIIENSIVDIEQDGTRSFGLYINEPSFHNDNDELYAQMVIDMDIEIHQSEEQSCKIQFSIEGAFLATDVEEKRFRELVIVNGAAALIGISRGKIEAITGNIFNAGKIVIPFVNVIDYYKSIEE